MASLREYRNIVGDKVIDEIYDKALPFLNKHVVCISSTHQGGGVAELLNSLVFLFNEIGIRAGWRIIQGTPDFFAITKRIHNALQGQNVSLSQREKRLYLETNRRFSILCHLDYDALVIVHDPQPLPLIEFYEKNQPWILRYHIDLSKPNKRVWNFLIPFIEKYDHMVVSTEQYKKPLAIPQSVIPPAIDPLSAKNRSMSESSIDKCLEGQGIDLNKPIISQISRFDKWKDPGGVIKIFEMVKKKVDCQLVLMGNTATDDPEGIEMYNEIIKRYGEHKDVKILVNVADNDRVANALQRKSLVVIQKSLREGFALTVSEALYKGTPIVASNIGGIPLQVIDGVSGFLHDPRDVRGFSESVVKLLKHEKLRASLGRNGKKHIIKNFLVTRLVSDWLDLAGRYLSH
jgi:trehalose synthase